MSRTLSTYRGVEKTKTTLTLGSILPGIVSDIMELIEELINELINTTTDIITTLRGLFK